MIENHKYRKTELLLGGGFQGKGVAEIREERWEHNDLGSHINGLWPLIKIRCHNTRQRVP